jgi:hypothetical protein
MTKKYLMFFIFITIISVTLTGCGGGAAGGLIGLAIENATDNDDTPAVIPTVSLSITGKVPTSTTPNPSPSKNSSINLYLAKDTESIYLLDSGDGISYATIETTLVEAGTYTFKYNFPTNVEHFLKVRSSITGDDMFIGKLANDATGTITVPITFDTMAVILTKIVEKQESQKFVICGDANLNTMKTSSMAWVQAKINGNLDIALASIKADDSTLTAAALSYDVFGSSLNNLFATSSNAFKWDLGTITLDNETKTSYIKEYLSFNSSSRTFSFNLYNSSTDSISLGGNYTYGTDNVELTISSVTNFPTDTMIFKDMDEIGDVFKVTNFHVYNDELISAKLNETIISMRKEIVVDE